MRRRLAAWGCCAALVVVPLLAAKGWRAIERAGERQTQLRELQRHEAEFGTMLQQMRRGEFQPRTRRDI
jgi:hypothetical protein